jgi:hypothetical protein
VPSLIGIWATAPFLHNNALGAFTGDPSVAGRMQAFDDGMTRLLWPNKRLDAASIARTSQESSIQIPAQYLPLELRPLATGDFLEIGPIPAGTPVDLLANASLDFSSPVQAAKLLKLAAKIQADLLAIRAQKMDAAAAQQQMRNLAPDLLAISKCPDFVQDRGHYFGANLPDSDKRALIEFLKTF